MKYAVFTFSRAELIDLCPWIANDEAPDPVKTDGPGPDAKVGRAFHRVVATVINQGMGSGPSFLIDGALKAEGLDVEKYRMRLASLRPIEHAMFAIKMGGPATQAEITVAFDLASGEGKYIGQDLNRQYEPVSGRMYGTMDLLHGEFDSGDGTLTKVIGDWKVGPMARQEVTPAATNKQLGLEAFAVISAFNAERVRVELRFINADGDLFIDSHTYDQMSIAEIDVWLQDLEQRIAAATGPTPGPHCAAKRCPLLSVCPDIQKSINEVVVVANMYKQEFPIEPTMLQRDWPLNVTSRDQLQSVDHAKLILSRARAVKWLCDQMLEVCKDWTDFNGVIVLGKNKVFGPKEFRTREIKGKSVQEIREVLAKFLPPAELDKLVYATSGINALGVAVKARADVGSSAAAEREVMAALKAADLFEEGKGIQYRDHKPSTGDKKAGDDDE